MNRLFLLFFVLVLSLLSCDVPSAPPKVEEGDDMTSSPTETEPIAPSEYRAKTPGNVKAVWLSQWDMQRVYLDGDEQREETDFRLRAGEIMENAVKDGFNTVFLQVRPFGDSFYPSKIYPPSKMVVGSYGGDFAYDPFEILIDAAHQNGLSVHAWINPFRLMTDEEIQSVPDSFAVRQWYESAHLRGRYLVLQGDGRWYLNPGYVEVRDLIVSGAREIMEHYEVDGLHLDDYFYPTTSSEYDAECFSDYVVGGGTLALDDFRREAVSVLVRELYGVVHQSSDTALFGIAPGGNPDRAYSAQYADVFRWCAEEGFVDYICPEIYFGFEHETYPFDKTADRWSKMVSAPSVRLIIGLSFHKASAGFDQYAGKGAYEWATHSDVLFRSLEYAARIENCTGCAVFSYQYFRNALTGEVPEYPKGERDAFLPLWRQVVFPAAVRYGDV